MTMNYRWVSFIKVDLIEKLNEYVLALLPVVTHTQNYYELKGSTWPYGEWKTRDIISAWFNIMFRPEKKYIGSMWLILSDTRNILWYLFTNISMKTYCTPHVVFENNSVWLTRNFLKPAMFCVNEGPHF